jgi:hypothetical protein
LSLVVTIPKYNPGTVIIPKKQRNNPRKLYPGTVIITENFLGIITIPGFFSGIIPVPGIFLGIITTPSFVWGLLLYYFREHYYPLISLGIITELSFISGIITTPLFQGLFRLPDDMPMCTRKLFCSPVLLS